MPLALRNLFTLATLLAARYCSGEQIWMFTDEDCPVWREASVCNVSPGQCCHEGSTFFTSCMQMGSAGITGYSTHNIASDPCRITLGSDPRCFTGILQSVSGCKVSASYRYDPYIFFPGSSGPARARRELNAKDEKEECMQATHRAVIVEDVQYLIATNSTEFQELEKITNVDDRRRFFVAHGQKADHKEAPKKDDAKKDVAEKSDAKNDDPKKADPKKDDPKKDDPKKDDPKRNDPNKADTKKSQPIKDHGKTDDGKPADENRAFQG